MILSKQDNLVRFLSTGLWTGYAPFIPGTFGTLLGVGVYMLFSPFTRIYLMIFTLVLLVIGIKVSDRAEILFGKKDPSFIVIDEVVGYLISMLFLPFQLEYVIISFIVFRVMDIIKPYPAGKWQEFHGGLGIMIDDVVAGIYTGILILICVSIFGDKL